MRRTPHRTALPEQSPNRCCLARAETGQTSLLFGIKFPRSGCATEIPSSAHDLPAGWEEPRPTAGAGRSVSRACEASVPSSGSVLGGVSEALSSPPGKPAAPRPRPWASHVAFSPGTFSFLFFRQLNEKVHVHCLFYFSYPFFFGLNKIPKYCHQPCREVLGGKGRENCQRKKALMCFKG